MGNGTFAAGQTPVSASEGFRWGQEHTPGYTELPYNERVRLDVLRRRSLIAAEAPGSLDVPPDAADVALKAGYLKRAGGSSRSAILGAY